MRPRSGTEPVTARSAYGLRAVLSVGAVLGGAVGAVWFGVAAARPGGTMLGEIVAALLCAAAVVTATVDVLAIRRRTATKHARSHT